MNWTRPPPRSCLFPFVDFVPGIISHLSKASLRVLCVLRRQSPSSFSKQAVLVTPVTISALVRLDGRPWVSWLAPGADVAAPEFCGGSWSKWLLSPFGLQ